MESSTLSNPPNSALSELSIILYVPFSGTQNLYPKIELLMLKLKIKTRLFFSNMIPLLFESILICLAADEDKILFSLIVLIIALSQLERYWYLRSLLSTSDHCLLA